MVTALETLPREESVKGWGTAPLQSEALGGTGRLLSNLRKALVSE